MPDGPIRLEAPPHFDPPRLTGLGEGIEVSRPTRTQGSTVYWDTPDLRLARWGCSLMSVEREGWTVTMPAAQGSSDRQAQSFAVAGSEEAPPAGALDFLTAYVRTAELLPVGRLRRVRQAVEVGGGNGSGLKVLSDEVSVLHGRRVAIRYRELVLDVGREADTALVHGVIARLRAAGAGGPDPVPEYARVLGPGAMEAPEVVVHRPGPESTLGHAVTAAIAGSVQRLLRHDAGVRRGDDSESVHQARVATRRLRSDLATFKTLLEPGPVATIRAELKWVGGLLGDVRDTDVLIERVTGRLREIRGPAAGQRAILKRLTDRRTSARVRMLEGLRSDRYARLLDTLVAVAADPPMRQDPDGAAAGPLPRLVAPAWKRLQHTVDQLGERPADEDLHAVRIAAKAARYAAEAVAPVVGRRAARFAAAVAALQQTLGDFNDTVVARQWLGEVSTGLGPGAAFYAGVLTERERLLGEEAIAGWVSAWKKLDRKKLHDWIGHG